MIDFQASNLHLVSYSVPVRATMPLAELKGTCSPCPTTRLGALPTSYYAERWGFCASQRLVDSLPEGDYEVCVDTTLADGHLTYGEHLVEGGPPTRSWSAATSATRRWPTTTSRGSPWPAAWPGCSGRPRPRYSYRFLFIPGTIGSITWLARNQDRVGRIRHGLVLSGVGDPGGFTYKRSRRGDAEIDRAVAHVLARSGRPTGWSTSRPTATTSASSARPASTCPSAASAAPSSPPTPSTTPRPTTSTWSARPSSRTA